MNNKISKICWNSNNWRFPSGSSGKSPSSSSHETKYGYGHEEWLLDNSRIINGSHFAFLQPLNLKTDKHVNEIYDIILYTVYNSNNYYVGTIKNVNCISRKKSLDIYNIYKQKGWLKEMVKELENAGVEPTNFKSTLPEIFFNIEFKFSDFIPTNSEDLEEISELDENITTRRYRLLSQKNELILSTEKIYNHEGNLKSTEIRTRTLSGNSTFDPIHDKMQNGIFILLKTKFSDLYKKIDIEKNRVDIKALTYKNQWHYYEIKTDNPKLSIRHAIGQLLEYAFYPEKQKAEKLIIISNLLPDNDTQKYLRNIRKRFSIPIFYRSFNMELGELSKEY